MKIAADFPEGVERYDQHGFAVFNDKTFCESERHHPTEIKNKSSPAHMEAWKAVLTDWSRTQTNGCSKLRSLLRKGVPPSLRQQLWQNLLGCQHLKQTSKFNYKTSVRLIRRELVDIGISEYCLRPNQVDWNVTAESEISFPVPPQVIRQITVDVDRTFPTHRQFMEGSHEAKEGRASLFRLLAVYALYNPQVGYCQGMSYIAGMLLMQMTDEEEAFWSMVALFEKPKYLSGYFDQSLLRIQQHAAVFQKLITHRLPKFANHLASMDLHLLTFVTPWFMCLYTSFPCWDTVLAIWDLLLLDGICTIFRVALAVLRLSQDELLQTTDLARILPRLLHPPPELVNAEHLLPVVWRTTVEKWEIDSLQAIVAEESDDKPGRKRRRRIDSDAGKAEVVEKRPRNGETEEENETSVFRRVLSLFKSSNQQAQRGSTTRSQTAKARAANRVTQRRKTPGVAKATAGLVPRPSNTTALQHSNPTSSAEHKAPDLKNLNLAPTLHQGSTASRNTKAPSMKGKDPDSSRKTVATASVKWSKFFEPATASCTSPWKEGLKALTFSLPVQQGMMIFGGGNNQYTSVVSEELPDPKLMEKLQAALGEADVNNNSAVAARTKDDHKTEDEDDRISPCIIATEDSCLDGILKLNSSNLPSVKRDSVKGVRFSPRRSGDRATLRKLENIKPLNTPSGRRIISKSAKVQHSFKTFHTPTPLRRSQMSRLNSSPQFSSPEIELQPMKLRAHMRKFTQE
ncbi:TBC1 domain family member 10B-like [Patiria miniata]|uniref:Rab-GAP TBC domain-containing protein n=1 Tax=Patiria miniata TaxID=46514 RepID=A0A913ZS49_PATMI|nr:TBC1 domain family member 10B-like [Patiria miniata]